MTVPNPTVDDPKRIADWIKQSGFPLDQEEETLLILINANHYASAPNCVSNLYELRILYWQVYGFLRGQRKLL